jgi:steroid delta-isomerase-like uncharacterized protein
VTASCEVVRKYLDAFWACRWAELRELLAEDAIYLDPLLPELVRGREAVLQVLAYCHAWGSYKGEIERLFGTASHVAAELSIYGVITAPPEGMSEAVVGKAFRFLETDLFDIDDNGRISRQAVYADALGLSKQLGEPFF